jgi:urea transport system substrate-binding protein
MESSYLSVWFWKGAVEKAKSLETARVRAAVAGDRLDAPEGPVVIDGSNYYGSRVSRIGRMGADGNFEIVHSSPRPMATRVYAPPRDRQGWEEFLSQLREGWGGRWTGPSATP